MSNLSDIGFPIKGEQDINEMILQVINHVKEIRCERGLYLKFADASGAELYLQGNFDQELIGFNPHFAGQSRRTVALTKFIERDSSELDGGFHAWANPQDESGESGDYPFIFDAPDFRTVPNLQLPKTVEIQLTAFASNDFKMFSDEREYLESQENSLKYAAKSFVPSGLVSFELPEGEDFDLTVLRPISFFSGEVKAVEVKTNELTKENFYSLLVETLGGEVDVVADPKLVAQTPQTGNIVSGQFWLSGRII